MVFQSLLVASAVACVGAQDIFLEAKPEKPQLFSWGWDDESPLDTYVNKPDPHFGWQDTGARVSTLLGGTGHLLNVTSQQWLDESRAHHEQGDKGSVWSHQVLTIVPKTLKVKNRAMIYITGGCNENPSVPKATDEEPIIVDGIGADVGAIAVVLYQIPNCHMVYPSDPLKKPRSEDAMIAWAWHMYLETGDPEWIPFLPMVKAAMAAMQSVQEYTKQQGIADIDGWVVAGASKRGWTTWLTGAVNCPTCPNVVALAPIVPIVPNIVVGIHHMWQAFGGFTFAFKDYTDVNITTRIDDPEMANMMKIVDPINYIDRLERLPKTVLVSSGDEFMMFEQTQNWFDKFSGEKHLYIIDNAEHSMATGVVGLFRTLSSFVNSIFLGGTRPTFSYNLDLKNGLITVQLPEGQPRGEVVLRHAHTLSAKRRDFRLAVKATEKDNGNATCGLPLIGPISAQGMEACVQPIVWVGKTLEEATPGTYVAKIPAPIIGWTGAYVEVYFPSDTGLKQDYQLSTPGMVWPQTLPYNPCHGAECVPNLL